MGLGPKDLEHTPPAWHTLTLGERVSIPGLLGRLVVRKLDPPESIVINFNVFL